MFTPEGKYLQLKSNIKKLFFWEAKYHPIIIEIYLTDMVIPLY